jgi:Phage integrase, N-terminal SAM-like domain
MLDIIFRTPSALKRHRSVPLVKEREVFLMHLLRQGSSRPAVRTVAILLLHIIRVMKLRKMRDIPLAEVQEAANRWARYSGPHRMRPAGRCTTGYFTFAAKKWLRFHGRLKIPTPAVHPFAAQLDDFADYMKSVSLSAATVRSHTWKSAKFLAWFHRLRKSLRHVSLDDVDRFLAMKAATGWNPTTVAVAGQALRSFFRYAESQNWCRPGIAKGIKGPAIPKYNSLPQGPTWKQVRFLLEGCRTNRPADQAANQDFLVHTLGNKAILRTKDAYTGAVKRPEIEDMLRSTLVTLAREKLGWDVTATAAAQPARPIVDIFNAESPNFSKYRLAKAFLRWTREHASDDLTGDERHDWKTLIESINAALN